MTRTHDICDQCGTRWYSRRIDRCHACLFRPIPPPKEVNAVWHHRRRVRPYVFAYHDALVAAKGAEGVRTVREALRTLLAAGGTQDDVSRTRATALDVLNI